MTAALGPFGRRGLGRRALALVAAVLCALALLATATTVGAHGNHVTADPQVSADGTVVVERLFVLSDGWLVVHADDGGTPGEPIGHRRIGSGFHSGLEVGIDGAYWNGVENATTVWLVLHRDRGDEGFDPETDTPLQSFGRLAGDEVRIARGPNAASVVAQGFDRQETNGTVVVPRVDAPGGGHLALRAENASGDLGRIVASTPVPRGRSVNLTVELYRSFVAGRGSFGLYAELRRDDGDGTFEPAADPTVTADGEPVRSFFYLKSTVPAGAVEGDGTNATGDGTTPSAGDAGTTTALVNTPKTTTALVNTPRASTTAVADAGAGGSDGGSPASATVPATTTTGDTGAPGMAGFGVVAALLALAVVVVLRRRG